MNDDHLPEDLELVTPKHLRRDGPVVRLSATALAFNDEAVAALGRPKRVDVLFGAHSRMLVIRPASEGGRSITTMKTKTPPNGFQIGNLKLIERCGLPPLSAGRSHAFPARLVEGSLLVGPLPEADHA